MLNSLNESQSMISVRAPHLHITPPASSLHHHEPPHTQDDIDLTLRKHVSSSNNRRSASQIATNRLSLGDFSLISTVQSLPPNNTPGKTMGILIALIVPCHLPFVFCSACVLCFASSAQASTTVPLSPASTAPPLRMASTSTRWRP